MRTGQLVILQKLQMRRGKTLSLDDVFPER